MMMVMIIGKWNLGSRWNWCEMAKWIECSWAAASMATDRLRQKNMDLFFPAVVHRVILKCIRDRNTSINIWCNLSVYVVVADKKSSIHFSISHQLYPELKFHFSRWRSQKFLKILILISFFWGGMIQKIASITKPIGHYALRSSIHQATLCVVLVNVVYLYLVQL